MHQNKLFFGKLLGEVYRTQKALKVCNVDGATIFGLLNGFEDVINEQVEHRGITSEQAEIVTTVLAKYWPDNLEKATGYVIEGELKVKNIHRATARKVFIYLLEKGDFTELLAKIGTGHDAPADFHHLTLKSAGI